MVTLSWGSPRLPNPAERNVRATGAVLADRWPVTDVSNRPWSGITSASYASATEYCAACLIDENEQGYTHSKARCKLPVYEPQELGGRLNRNAVHAAANRLVRQRGGVDVPLVVKQRTAQRLLELYGDIGDPPPQALRHLANGGRPAVSARCVDAGGLNGRSL